MLQAIPHSQRFNLPAKWSILLLGFSLPISTSVTIIAAVSAMVFMLLAGKWQAKWHCLAKNRVAWASFLLLLLLAIGATYSPVPFTESMPILLKYNYLILSILLITFFSDRPSRMLGLYAFMGGMFVVMAFSWVGHVSPDFFNKIRVDIFGITHESTGVFKNHIITNVMMSFFVFILAHLGIHSRQYRWFCLFFALCGVDFIFFYSIGRAGYVTMLVFIVLFLWQTFGKKYSISIIVLVCLLLGTILATSTTVKQRVNQARQEYERFTLGNNHDSSVGQHLEFAINGLTLAKEYPFVGSGTGSVSTRYATLPADKKSMTIDGKTSTPVSMIPPHLHNQYLELAVQLGALGVAVLLYLFYCQWQACQQQDTLFKHIGQGFVLLFVVGCLSECMLQTVTDRHFFAYFSGLLFSCLQTESVSGRSCSPSP